MKVNIWIHKNDVINNKITDYSYTRPYHDRNDEWVQVSISVDEFARIEDKKETGRSTKNYTYPDFVKEHYKDNE